jgi:thioredoxin-related protein
MSRRNPFLLLLVFFASTSLVAAEWQTDYDKALERAKAENKRVLLDFTGSDWCGPCIQFAHDVLTKPQFLTYAEKNLILVEVDYPQRKKQSAELKKQNEQLASKYGIDEKGYPTVVLLDPSGKVIREFTGYGGEGPAEIIAWIEGKLK